MRTLVFNILIFFIFFKISYAVDINQSIKNTIESNPKVKIAVEKIKESKELIIYAKGAKLPDVTSSISGTYENADTTTNTSSTTPETFTDAYKLTITQNIYDSGFNDLEIQRSKILFDNELINFKVTIQDLILDAIEGYLSVIYYERSLEANQKNFDSVLKVFDETKTRFELGSATLYDLQNAEASYEIAKTNLFAAQKLLDISKKSFTRLVGLKPFNLDDNIDFDDKIDIDVLIKDSLNNNLNIILLSNNIQNKEILYLKEKKSKKPTLDFTGIASYSNGSRMEQGTESTSGSLALTLTVPIFQKGQDNSEIRKYYSQILQSEIELEDAKDDLQILISNTYKDYRISQSKMNSNLIVIESINTSLNILKEEYSIGTKSITDIINEEEKLLNAKVSYLNSKRDFLLNYFKLKSYDGTLIKLFENYLPKVN